VSRPGIDAHLDKIARHLDLDLDLEDRLRENLPKEAPLAVRRRFA
jgi:hypothetical protein